MLLWLVGLGFCLAACGGGVNQPLGVAGKWNVTFSSGGASVGTVTAQFASVPLVSGSCQIGMPDGTASEIAVVKTCFLADAGAGHGLVSNQVGNWDYPPAGFMLAMDAVDPLAGNTSANVSGISSRVTALTSRSLISSERLTRLRRTCPEPGFVIRIHRAVLADPVLFPLVINNKGPL